MQAGASEVGVNDEHALVGRCKGEGEIAHNRASPTAGQTAHDQNRFVIRGSDSLHQAAAQLAEALGNDPLVAITEGSLCVA